jgi:hypothetical protein
MQHWQAHAAAAKADVHAVKQQPTTPLANKDQGMKKTKAELNSIGLLAPLVMAQRLSRMMLPEHMKTSNDHAEDRRMVDEKTKAASDGFIAANVELSHQMMDAWVGMAFGKIPDFMKSADAVTAAALKPSRIKVTANAKRLTGKKK